MKRIIIATLTITLIAIIGCGQPLQSNVPADDSVKSANISQAPLLEPVMPCSDCPDGDLPVDYEIKAKPAEHKTNGKAQEDSALHPPASLMDVNWISPGKVVVANFHPGAIAEYPLTIHNGSEEVALFLVTYRNPDNVDEGWDKPSEDVQDWVIIADTAPVLDPKETRDIAVTLTMPDNAELFSQRWEFWVSVIDATQTGMVRTELCCRWLVTMRTE